MIIKISTGQKTFDSVKALFDVIKGIGIGKSEISLSILSEIDAGTDPYPGLLQNLKSQFI
jgi:hypothetical protein